MLTLTSSSHTCSLKKKNLQPVLVKLGDLVTHEPIQTIEPIPLSAKPKDFQLVRFELVSNHLTFGNIKRTNVLVQDNNVATSNDANDLFKEAFIDAYLLGVFNPKGYVHSQPQNHFCMK